MALFGKLFSKEACAVCGAEVGALKRKQVFDGVICKECAAKCSPWFDEFKQTPASSIQMQIEYREGRNKEQLDVLRADKVFGDFGAIIIDEHMHMFCAVGDTSEGFFSSPKQVTGVDDVKEFNPDVVLIKEVEDVDLEIVETRTEEKRSENGEQVSFDPKHWTYMYTFNLVIRTSHPFAKLIRVQLNNGAVRIPNEGERLRTEFNVGKRLADFLLDIPAYDVREDAAVHNGESLWTALTRNPAELPDYSYGFKCTQRNWDEIQRYGYYLAMAREVRSALMPSTTS